MASINDDLPLAIGPVMAKRSKLVKSISCTCPSAERNGMKFLMVSFCGRIRLGVRDWGLGIREEHFSFFDVIRIMFHVSRFTLHASRVTCQSRHWPYSPLDTSG